MPEIKLARLPDRTPIKIGIAILPELHERLMAYAAAYAEAYGVDEPVALSGQSAPSATLQ